MEGGELAVFSTHIGLIYDAALNPTLWPQVVEEITDWLRGRGGMLFTPFHSVDSTGFLFPARMEQAQLQEYASRYQSGDVWAIASAQKGYVVTGKVYTSEEVLPREELMKTEMYQTFMRKWDVSRACISIIFGNQDGEIPPTVLSVLRRVRSRPFDEKSKRWISLLTPHLSRALGVMCKLKTAELKVAASRAALDRLNSGVILVGAHRQVLFMNRAASAILQQQDGLFLRKSNGYERLACQSASEGEQLDRALRVTLDPQAVEVPHFSNAVRVGKVSGGGAYALSLSALPEGSEFDIRDENPRGVVFITDTQEPPFINHGLLRKMFGLSPVETRLVEQVCGGESLPEIALRVKVSETTLRTQLQSAFAKTGTNRQTELVKLVLSLSSYRT
jgi:DNA-binding CsgD family transcriptional regulator/PAS domain-containing protein